MRALLMGFGAQGSLLHGAEGVVLPAEDDAFAGEFGRVEPGTGPQAGKTRLEPFAHKVEGSVRQDLLLESEYGCLHCYRTTKPGRASSGGATR